MSPRIISILRHGGIAVIPTDTMYGIVARACDRNAVARLYELRRVTSRKPFIILIDSISRLREFGITLNAAQETFLDLVWPGKVSVVLPCAQEAFAYLHRGTKTLAFRFPKNKTLVALIRKTGPLVAPSANPEGKRPAETIAAAKRYFGAQVALYHGVSRKQGKPSTLVSLLDSFPKVLREGAVNPALFQERRQTPCAQARGVKRCWVNVTLPTADAVAYAKRVR